MLAMPVDSAVTAEISDCRTCSGRAGARPESAGGGVLRTDRLLLVSSKARWVRRSALAELAVGSLMSPYVLLIVTAAESG